MAEKIKIQLEFPMHCLPKVLYMRLSTPAGLEEWFADEVNIHDNTTFTFNWEGSIQKAKVVASKDLKFIRFKWLEEEDPNVYFEFKITIDELTGDLSLMVVDFVYENEKNDAIKLWNKQINELKHPLGSN